MGIVCHQAEAAVHAIIADAHLGDDWCLAAGLRMRMHLIRGLRLPAVIGVLAAPLLRKLVRVELVHLIVDPLGGPAHLQFHRHDLVVGDGVANAADHVANLDLIRLVARLLHVGEENRIINDI